MHESHYKSPNRRGFPTNSAFSSTFAGVQDQLPQWHFLVNPAAGAGKGRARWRKLLPQLRKELPGMTVAVSTPETDLRAITQDAVISGKTHLVGVGGDGTHHHILNALVETGRISSVVYAPLSLGSGNDWVRTLGTPTLLLPWLLHLRAVATKLHTVGQIGFLETGRAHYFLNVAGLAYDAEVVRIAAEERVRSRWMYPLLAAAYLKEYQAPEVRIDYNGQSFTGPVHTINVGLGRYSGGGMSFVPHADPFGGQLALTYAERLPSWKVLANSWRFYAGSIAEVRGVTTAHTNSVTITPVSGRLECEADGEWLGKGAVTISLNKYQLRVVVP